MNERKRLTPEERKALREKYSIHDKENETIYRHYGDLDGADFKIFKNKNCEIYILDWSKGMFIDDCENCTIICGPIDGSIFIRKSKNCKVSLIARQVRFRESENIDIYTYCPSDPVVESCFNIFFAPFNAFFPHLSDLFKKGGFNSEDKNHIDTPYDFTPSEVLGGGLPHFSHLSEDKFNIRIIRDGEAPVEEMFKGYCEKEAFLVNKASELPKFGEVSDNSNNKNINIDDFGFGDNEPKESKETLNDIIKPNQMNVNNNQNNLMNIDDFISGGNNNNNIQNDNNNILNFNTQTNSNLNNNNNNNMNFDMFNFDSNNNNNNNNQNTFNNNNAFNTYEISKQNVTKEMEEEIRLQQIREKTEEIRQERIRGLMEKEMKLKNEIISKAMNYMNQFYEERKKRIELNHQKLLEKANNQNKGNNSGNIWENIGSNMTGSSSSADRMREAVLNKSKQEQNK